MNCPFGELEQFWSEFFEQREQEGDKHCSSFSSLPRSLTMHPLHEEKFSHKRMRDKNLVDNGSSDDEGNEGDESNTLVKEVIFDKSNSSDIVLPLSKKKNGNGNEQYDLSEKKCIECPQDSYGDAINVRDHLDSLEVERQRKSVHRSQQKLKNPLGKDFNVSNTLHSEPAEQIFQSTPYDQKPFENSISHFQKLALQFGQCSLVSSTRFYIVHQPNERQRKSYKNEQRFILPSPLMVALREQSDGMSEPLIEGVVEVKLTDENGDIIEDQSVLEGCKVKRLGALECKASFQLKIVDVYEGTKFRLQFLLEYRSNGVLQFERLLSDTFRVISNKRRTLVEYPHCYDINPKSGPINVENEVWIKGAGFIDRSEMKVTFGDREAQVIESDENLLICRVPALSQCQIKKENQLEQNPNEFRKLSQQQQQQSRQRIPQEDCTVPVTVSNLHPTQGWMHSQLCLQFTFLSDDIEDGSGEEMNHSQVSPSSSVSSLSASPVLSQVSPSLAKALQLFPISMETNSIEMQRFQDVSSDIEERLQDPFNTYVI